MMPILHFTEKAREHLHKTGRFIVIGGIISPVHDSYGKPVRSTFAVQFYVFTRWDFFKDLMTDISGMKHPK